MWSMNTNSSSNCSTTCLENVQVSENSYRDIDICCSYMDQSVKEIERKGGREGEREGEREKSAHERKLERCVTINNQLAIELHA